MYILGPLFGKVDLAESFIRSWRDRKWHEQDVTPGEGQIAWRIYSFK